MNVLLIGSGGREHALAWKIANSPLLTTLFCAPGNPGTEKLAQNVELDISNHEDVVKFCKENAIDLVIIGPESPLVEGLADPLRTNGIYVFGPSKEAARLEGSKGFTKDLCAQYNIPTSAYGRFSNAEDAKHYIQKKGAPIVVKADGIAAGKGVVVAMTIDEALQAVDDCFNGHFGNAGAELVIENFLVGEEASFFCLCDGQRAIPFGTAQDHKRVGDSDKGANTGGMGAYSPAPIMNETMIERTMHEIVEPTIMGMKERGTPFCGVLFVGLMITDKGPELIEYNVRFGDPECQVLMMRLKSDLLEIVFACAKGDLSNHCAEWSNDKALTVVMAAQGYPETPKKGSIICALDKAEALPDIVVFHAGTACKNGELIANGGRVLNVSAIGHTVAKAQEKAYHAVDQIDWPQGFCRRDIGWRAIAREK
ncbi:phosphoribosylamine--glycine ligase [Bartonella tamiae]|uniref:Phosphoribosylamine--glycine ligase n=1 Tax=Bartonella tamiae Th239 TaxID=1094558 RepID=J1JZG6_9HYPH|nr:phosphoribosylamine--glycine ligase [Bartonella tamiae]EJF90512.1 phosphoribosylamine-glycine ligase [Bartonella tamiae Th239]EJF93544.1 phosphoribosylamine-glycine ligase [Bartonella tamiae Th307]